MESIRRIIREEMDDLEWIKDISVDKRVTTDNWYQGMRVKLNPDSIFADQSEEIGVIIDSEADLYFCSEKDSDSNDSMCYWITVEWEDGYENNYRIGPYEWDLLIDADSYLNESDDLEWIKENPIEVGKCFRIYDFYGNVDATVTIKEIEQREWKDNIRQKGGKFNPDDIIIHLVGVTQKDKERVGPNYRISYNDLVYNINNGFEVPTDCGNSINESDDLQWIKDIKPIPELKIGTCFIDVMDSTKTEWIIIDFKMTPGGTHIVVIKNKKNNVDIRHMHEEYFEQDLLNGRYKPC